MHDGPRTVHRGTAYCLSESAPRGRSAAGILIRMTAITLSNGPLRCTVLPALGGGISDFSLLGPSKFYYPLMRRAAPGETNSSSLGSFFMAPWVNRIANATFEFEGRAHRLKPNSPSPGAPAQHGDVRARAWKVESQSPEAATLTFDSIDHQNVNWPWRFGCRALYQLSSASLRIGLEMENRDSTAFPAGCGHHPYFSRRLWDDCDQVELYCPVTGRYPLENGVPTGPAVREALTEHLQALRGTPKEHVDTVFAGFDAARGASIRYPASGVTLKITASSNMGHLVLYCPHADGGAGGVAKPSPLSFIAVEPQSQVNGALNWPQWGSATGTVVLRPGESLKTWTEFGVTVG
jgi:aldose 1-epimerase